MAVTLQQTDTAPNCAAASFCSGRTLTGTPQDAQAQRNGTAGTIEQQIDVGNNDVNTVCYTIEGVIPSTYDGASGDWTVNLNVSTGNTNLQFTEIYICRVNSSCTSQETLASVTGLTDDASAGVHQWVINQGTNATFASGDTAQVVFVMSHVSGHGGQSFSVTPSETIEAPGSAGQSFTTSLADPVGITDTVSTSRSLVHLIADTVGITDVISTARDLIISLADSIDITDVLSIPSTTFEQTISVNDDDAAEISDGTVNLGELRPRIDSANDVYTIQRFTNVTIPQGATIDTAVLRLNPNNSNRAHPGFDIYADNVDDSAQPQQVTNDISGRTATTASVLWDTGGADLAIDQYHDSPEIKTVIQEIVDRAGWASGNALSLICADQNISGDFQHYHHDDTPANAPTLYVEYTEPSGGVTAFIADSIGITDSVSTSRSLAILLTDAVGITDVITTSIDKIITLADTVGITDIISAIVGGGGTGLITQQMLEDDVLIDQSIIDFVNVNLDSSTEKIVCVISSALYDATAGDPAISSVTWDQGGTNEGLTHVPNSESSLVFQTDRYLKTDVWVLDNPTLATDATLRVTLSNSADSGGVMLVGLYEFDSAADTGTSGDVGTDTGTGSTDPSIDLTTRDSDSMVLMGGIHQVADANPFTIGGILTTKDNDSDASGSWPVLMAHGNGTGGIDTASYTQSVQRRFASSAYEVLVSPSGGVGITVALADAIGITDTVTTSRNLIILLTDPIAIADIITTSIDKVISLIETIDVTDALTTSRNIVTSLADSVGITDTINRSLVKVTNIADSVGITDTISTARNIVTVLTDPVSVADVISTSTNKIITLAETVGITDTVTTTINKVVVLADAVGITDALTTARDIIVALADPVGIADTITTEVQQLIEVLIQDTVGATDAITTARNIVLSISDNVGITDVISISRDIIISLAENVDVTDTLQTAVDIVVSISDAIGITDVINAVVDAGQIVVSLADNVSVTDSISTVSNYVRTVSESIGITDTINTVGSFIVSISDAISVSDVLNTSRNVIISIVDSVGITDAIAVAKFITASIVDSVSITDTLSNSRNLVRNLTDNVDVTDVFETVQTLIVQFSESVGITDTLSSVGTYIRSVGDSINITDTISRNIGNLISVLIEETVNVTDNLSGVLEVVIVAINDIRGTVKITPELRAELKTTPIIQAVVKITSEIRKILRI